MTKEARPSPTSSATLYKVGTIKPGNDGNKWIIAENKNGIKKWKKYKIIKKQDNKSRIIKKQDNKSRIRAIDLFNIKKIVSEKNLEKIAMKNIDAKNIYNILKTKIIPEINKLNIKIFIVPLPLSDNNIYWSDYANIFVKEVLKKDLSDIKYMIFTFYLNYKADEINTNKNIKIELTILNKENKNKIIQIFENYFPNNYKWNGSNARIMEISFNN